ncbi:hypothetical protein R3P38DRAFT_2816542 [Favolaschia claudopus]|uniref:Uncharacterized protein n=1 Tax=Favolaschia claudopus TaxID=2862362 RepID=A0AAV9YYJ2_9AGAR
MRRHGLSLKRVQDGDSSMRIADQRLLLRRKEALLLHDAASLEGMHPTPSFRPLRSPHQRLISVAASSVLYSRRPRPPPLPIFCLPSALCASASSKFTPPPIQQSFAQRRYRDEGSKRNGFEDGVKTKCAMAARGERGSVPPSLVALRLWRSPSADIQTTSRLIRGLAHSPLSSSRSLDLFLVRLVIQPLPPGRTLRWIPSPSPRKERRGREDRTSRCKAWGERVHEIESKEDGRPKGVVTSIPDARSCTFAYPNSVPLISTSNPPTFPSYSHTSHLLLEPSGIVPQESTSTEVSQATRERIRGRGGRSEIEDPRSCVPRVLCLRLSSLLPNLHRLTYPPTQRATVARSLRYGKKDGGGLLHKASIGKVEQGAAAFQGQDTRGAMVASRARRKNVALRLGNIRSGERRWWIPTTKIDGGENG